MSAFQITFVIFAPLLALGLAALGGFVLDAFKFSPMTLTVVIFIWIGALALLIWGVCLHVLCWQVMTGPNYDDILGLGPMGLGTYEFLYVTGIGASLSGN